MGILCKSPNQIPNCTELIYLNSIKLITLYWIKSLAGQEGNKKSLLPGQVGYITPISSHSLTISTFFPPPHTSHMLKTFANNKALKSGTYNGPNLNIIDKPNIHSKSGHCQKWPSP